MNKDKIDILLVEDNPAHAELVIDCFDDTKTIKTYKHVKDGEEALEYLFNKGEYQDKENNPLPRIILLDLRLPKVDGFEVLESIKSDNDLKNTPVIILTTSEAENDIVKAYNKRANSYLLKPVSYQDFKKLISDFSYYWNEWNKT